MRDLPLVLTKSYTYKVEGKKPWRIFSNYKSQNSNIQTQSILFYLSVIYLLSKTCWQKVFLFFPKQLTIKKYVSQHSCSEPFEEINMSSAVIWYST